jgi:branched-chain amino acid transport system permease protein
MRERPFRLIDAVKLGVYGGIAVMLIALIGMVQVFSTKGIIANRLTMAQVLVYGVIVAVALSAGGRAGAQRRLRVPASMIAGSVAALLPALLALLMARVNLRSVLLNATPQLADLLLPGTDNDLLGAIWLVLIGAGIGLVIGGIEFLPRLIRRSLITAVTAVVLIGLLQAVFVVIIPDNWRQFLYTANGLSTAGALTLLGIIAPLSYLMALARPRTQQRVGRLAPARRRVLRGVVTLAMLGLLAILPRLLGPFLSEVADTVGIYIIMGMGLNIVVGFAGLLDLGYVAFFAIGAYTMAVLTTPDLPVVRAVIPQMNFWEALPFALLISFISGVLLGIPVLKTRGDYLAIITLGFGEIIRLLVLSDALKPILGGAQGITGVARPRIGDITAITPQQFFYPILVGIMIAWFITARLKNSRLGRSWMAIREDEDVAAAIGINLVGYKLMAFATGATLAGLGGALFGSKLGSMVPASFNVLVSINVLALLIVGGMGSIPGVIVGAIALIGLPELLREFNEFRWWVYGIVLVGMMIFKPEGWWPEATRLRELHEAEEAVPVEEAETAAVPA